MSHAPRNSDLEADKKSLEARVERLHNEMEYTNKELTMLRAARDDAENLARKVGSFGNNTPSQTTIIYII